MDALAPDTDEDVVAAKATGSCRPSFDPWISEWGKPSTRDVRYSGLNDIGPVEGTGDETSQYPEETKATCDSLSSGERNGISLNRCGAIAQWRCHIGVVGLTPAALAAGPSYKVAV